MARTVHNPAVAESHPVVLVSNIAPMATEPMYAISNTPTARPTIALVGVPSII